MTSVRWSAALVGGPVDLLDFLIPLWAGSALGVDATMIGLLVATELLVSFVARFPAGLLADVSDRRCIAAAGAAIYGISCVGYAFSSSPAIAFASAVVGGVGGALFWVPLRAMVSETVAEDSSSFPRLMAWQETGSWVAFVAGLTLIGSLDFRGVFLGASLACFIAAALLVSAPRHPVLRLSQEAPAIPSRRHWPMLLATAVTSLAEAAIGLLLLLHLQSAFDFDVVSVALVFLPGAIVMSLMPVPAHRLTMRIGRRKVVAIAALSSALFAFSLGFAPSPLLIAALWILSGAAWATISPIEQSVIAEASGDRAGRGFGLYESARLAGAGAGAIAAGISYATTNWQIACFLFASIIAMGALITPWAVKRSGATNFPRDSNPLETAPQISSPAAEAKGTAPRTESTQEEKTVTKTQAYRSRFTGLTWHAAIFAVVQIGLALTGWSWIIDSFSTNDLGAHLGSGGRPELEGVPSFIYNAGKIWVIVLIIDVLWTVMAGRKRK
ncbi:MFS transporter [Arthrobacter sp. TMT4-20]